MKSENGLKKCSKCGEVKGVEDYRKDNQKSDGLYSSCRLCVSIAYKNYYIINSHKVRELSLLYNSNNRLKVQLSTKKYRNKNKDRLNELQKKYRMENKDDRKRKYISDVASLTDTYVKGVICCGSKIPAIFIPPELIEIKRTILKTKRLCKTLKNSEVN